MSGGGDAPTSFGARVVVRSRGGRRHFEKKKRFGAATFRFCGHTCFVNGRGVAALRSPRKTHERCRRRCHPASKQRQHRTRNRSLQPAHQTFLTPRQSVHSQPKDKTPSSQAILPADQPQNHQNVHCCLAPQKK